MEFQIKQIFGRVELHINGKFYCSADNEREAIQEYNKYVKERLKNENKSAKKELQHS